ncbi:MAG: type II secretion system F family protein [Pseudoruegeria sp.]
MRSFSYIAHGTDGKRKKGVILAETDSHANELLKAKGLFASEITAKEARQAMGGGGFRRHRLNSELQSVFTRQMAVLLAAELPSEAALDVIREAGTNAALETMATRAKAALMDGQPLSDALAGSGGGFARYYLAAIRAGETSGDVALVFDELADHLESAGEDRNQIATALIYPAFVAAVSLLVCAILMINVAPEIVAMFEISGRPLPQITQVVLGISDWVQANILWLAIGSVSVVLAFMLALRVPRLRDRLDGVLLRLPLAGRLIQLAAAAQYLRTLALVISSKQAVLDATQSAAEVLVIRRFRTEADQVCIGIRNGESLSVALKRLSIIPPVALQLISAGERSARLARMSERGAVMVEGWLKNERKRIAALLDPILMMCVGAFVLVIVLAILLPIFDLQSAVTV